MAYTINLCFHFGFRVANLSGEIIESSEMQLSLHVVGIGLNFLGTRWMFPKFSWSLLVSRWLSATEIIPFSLSVGLNFSATRCPRLSIYNEGDLVPFSSQYPAHEVHKMIDIFIESLRRVLRDFDRNLTRYLLYIRTSKPFSFDGRMPKDYIFRNCLYLCDIRYKDKCMMLPDFYCYV